MTYREWMTAMTARFNMTDTDINLILTNRGIAPDEEVDIQTAKVALCHEFASILPLANISEGGYSLTWNIEGIKLWYRQMCNELGIVPVGLPRVRNASNRW